MLLWFPVLIIAIVYSLWTSYGWARKATTGSEHRSSFNHSPALGLVGFSWTGARIFPVMDNRQIPGQLPILLKRCTMKAPHSSWRITCFFSNSLEELGVSELGKESLIPCLIHLQLYAEMKEAYEPFQGRVVGWPFHLMLSGEVCHMLDILFPKKTKSIAHCTEAS